MAQMQVTMVKVSDWRAPRGMISLFTYREPARAKNWTFTDDKLIVGINPDGFPSPPPNEIRVTVEWGEGTGEPLPSSP